MDEFTAKDTQEKEKDRMDESIEYTREKDRARRAINKLIIECFLPASTLFTLIILMICEICDKSKGFIWFPLSITVIYVVFIIALILALVIINKSED